MSSNLVWGTKPSSGAVAMGERRGEVRLQDVPTLLPRRLLFM